MEFLQILSVQNTKTLNFVDFSFLKAYAYFNSSVNPLGLCAGAGSVLFIDVF